MRFFPAIAANVFVLASALGYGAVLRRLFPQGFSILDRISLTLLGGLGLLGTLLFDIGQAWFARSAIVVILLVGILLGLLSLASALRKRSFHIPKIDIQLLPALIIASVLLMTALAGLAEPVGDIKMDAIAYHFLGPKVWLREGIIRPVLDEAYTAFPGIVETQYAALMDFGGPRAPQFFAVIALVSILLLAAALALRFGLDAKRAWWVAALIVTMPVVYRGAHGGFVDVIYSGFVLAAARVGFDAEHPRHYVLFGLFCGFAAGTKYTGVIAVVLLAVCTFLIATVIRGQDKKVVLKYLGLACVTATIVGAPSYIRNWALLGCPIYPPPPVLSEFFQVKYLPRAAIHHFHQSIWRDGGGMGRDPVSFLLLPLRLTFHPANFLNGAGGIGLAPLALGPFGVLACRRNIFAKAFVLFALLQTIAWFITEQEARFLIHTYVLAAIFAVSGWQYVRGAAPRFAPALSSLLVAVSIAYGFFMIASMNKEDMHAVVSAAFNNKRRGEQIPFLDSFAYLNREPSVQRVLVLNPRVPTYYLDKHYVKPIGRWGEQALPEAQDLPRILSGLPRLRISHILDVRLEESDFRLPEHSPGLTLVFQRQDQRIYRVDGIPGFTWLWFAPGDSTITSTTTQALPATTQARP